MTKVLTAFVPDILDAVPGGEAPAQASRRLLLVDDEPRLLESLRALLEDQGHELVTAHGGRDAVEKLASARFDLVLLDLRMPDMDGRQVMQWINSRGMDVTVIILSGETIIDAAIGALHQGAYAYLRKPYQPTELFSAVENAIQKRRLEEENRAYASQLADSEQRYRFLINSSPDIIYTLDAAGHFTFVNKRVTDLLGFLPDELVGQAYSAIVHGEDRDRAHYLLNERRQGLRSSRSDEIRFRTRDAASDCRTFEVILQSVPREISRIACPDRQGSGVLPGSAGTYGIARDITERKQAEALIHYQAYHDVLTSLPNRTYFRERLERALEACAERGTTLGIMFLDLDRFKIINDSLGHQQGDAILKQVAERLKGCLRRDDMLARVGGDEFLVLIPNLREREVAETVAGKFLHALCEPFLLGQDRLHVSVSIGIAVFPKDGASAEDLIRHADLAMYEVKDAGKNGYRFYDPAMLDKACEKIRLEQSLRRALERGELEMYYQPQVDVNSGMIISAEALMRWNHPELGLLNAGQFLPIAEEVGLMVPLSDWMIRTVCQDVQHWRQMNCRTIQIAINLSPSCLDREDFYGKLRHALTESDVSPTQIEVEITENFCIGEPEHAIDQLNKLAGIGVRVAIDDFGTGYSSLAYLHRFRIHTLKIDQSFVREIKDRTANFPVVLAVISIAQGLKLNLVAEGVETALQADYLEQAGCQTMQGYHFHKPMAKNDFAQLIAGQG